MADYTKHRLVLGARKPHEYPLHIFEPRGAAPKSQDTATMHLTTHNTLRNLAILILTLTTRINATVTSTSYHRYHERPPITANAPAADATITVPPAMSSLSTMAPNDIAHAYDSAIASLDRSFNHEMDLVHANATAQMRDLQARLSTWTLDMSASYRQEEMQSVQTWAYYCNKWKAENSKAAAGQEI